MSLNETIANATSTPPSTPSLTDALGTNSSFLTDAFENMLHLGSTSAEILASFVIFAVMSVIGWSSYLIISRVVCNWTKKTETTLDDEIVGAVKIIIIIMVVVFGIEFSLSPLTFLQGYSDILNGLFLAIQILLSAYAVSRVAHILADWFASKTSLSAGKSSNHLIFILKKVITIACFIIAFVIILNSLNLQGALETTLVGFGVGGIAVAFALQSTLSDVFSAFSLYFDHPFEIGDFIVVGDYSGTVKSIGMRATRIQLLQGEELVISNKELTSASIRNFRKLETRRITFTMGVTYDTTSEKLKKIPKIIGDIISSTEKAKLDRVNFTEYGDFSLKFLVVYYVMAADWGVYLNVQEKINFAIKEAFEKEGIEIAFPTNVTYLKK
jgi:small-conductance mechanosensitive channel